MDGSLQNTAKSSRLPAELLSKVVSYVETPKLQSILMHSSAFAVTNNNPEILNFLCRTSDRTRDECLRILSNGRLLVQAIKKGLEHVVTFVTNQSDMTQLTVFGGRIFVSSDDQSLKIFDFTGFPVKKFIGHLGGIWTFDCLGNVLVTGSTDKTAKIWHLNTEQSLVTLKYHRSTVRVVRVYGDYVITGSRDYTIAVWNVLGDLIYRLNGHRESVRCLDVNGEYLVSGSYDGVCKLWDYKKGKFIRDLHHHNGKIYCVKMFDGYVASAGYDSEVKISRIDGSEAKSYRIHTSVVGWIDFRDCYVVTSSLDGTVVKYNYVSGVVEYVIRLGYPIKGQKMTENLIVIAAIDRVVVFTQKTGQFVRTLIITDAINKIEVVDWKIIVGYQHMRKSKISVFDYENHRDVG